jgi:hypothetical protein
MKLASSKSTPGMPKTWADLNLGDLKQVKVIKNDPSTIKLQEVENAREKPNNLNLLNEIRSNNQLNDELEQSSNFSINKVYSFIQSSSNLSFQQPSSTLSSDSPNKIVTTKKSKVNTKIFNYFQFHNKSKLENFQALKKLMRLNVSPSKLNKSERKKTPQAPNTSSFSKFDQEDSTSELRINHFFPNLMFPKLQNKAIEKQRAVVNENKMFNNTPSNDTLGNFADISLIYIKQNEIEKEDNKKLLKELNSESVFTDPKNFIEPLPVSLNKRKNGNKRLLESKSNSSLISFSQLPVNSMNNLLASSTASIIANRKLPMVNLTTEHEKKSFNRYVSTINLVEDKIMSEPAKPLHSSLNETILSKSMTTTTKATIVPETLDFEDTFYKSTFLITTDNIVEQQLKYTPAIPKSPAKKRVHFIHNNNILQS